MVKKIMLKDPEDVAIALANIKEEKSQSDWNAEKKAYIDRTKNVENAVNYMANRYTHMAISGGDGDLARRLEEKVARNYENR